ncbi:NAD-dependent epimerase/dehydratase family protein [Gloeocapsopsis dulcis]|uniref:UDP-glucose 4-epimerase n=1 Tax=Gloeocapsopsis dulcis AAB1 = 1H9 TaxID=1433147 RepID=A0A6N8G0W6_9CHRO|nr:NAD-dependent epimerase/dehydratase family protein [Gloeocapsopsis dulcis]MUL38739.1 UDP-glucose 4-epimerase [Gloeocapsopsis dulcis AAB1 = 1H9]WNN91652.1 NAD-dependent epimerase/dehydratase family protein [Gloeocapsopsis dulcis]
MHFIVTGGAGFIGSHVTEQLLSEGHTVTVVDNLTTGNLQNLPKHPRLKFLQKDVFMCQPKDFAARIDGIAHLAAIPSVTESWLRPLEAHHHNLSTMIAVIQLCQVLNIPRLVFASSAAVYGKQSYLPISEHQDTCPISPYGLQKLVCEQYASLFAKQLGFSFVALRMFNVFGLRQLPSSQYSGVISVFVSAMQQGLPITIYGDGTQTRDFIYVKDVAIAFAKALTIPLAPGSYLTCNLGTGKATSLVQLVDILKACFPQWKAEARFSLSRPGDIQHSQADISRANLLLGFSPQWSVQSSINLFLNLLCSI